ncbi:unnamed protein product [Chrysoparadoxa australica]
MKSRNRGNGPTAEAYALPPDEREDQSNPEQLNPSSSNGNGRALGHESLRGRGRGGWESGNHRRTSGFQASQQPEEAVSKVDGDALGKTRFLPRVVVCDTDKAEPQKSTRKGRRPRTANDVTRTKRRSSSGYLNGKPQFVLEPTLQPNLAHSQGILVQAGVTVIDDGELRSGGDWPPDPQRLSKKEHLLKQMAPMPRAASPLGGEAWSSVSGLAGCSGVGRHPSQMYEEERAQLRSAPANLLNVGSIGVSSSVSPTKESVETLPRFHVASIDPMQGASPLMRLSLDKSSSTESLDPCMSAGDWGDVLGMGKSVPAVLPRVKPGHGNHSHPSSNQDDSAPQSAGSRTPPFARDRDRPYPQPHTAHQQHLAPPSIVGATMGHGAAGHRAARQPAVPAAPHTGIEFQKDPRTLGSILLPQKPKPAVFLPGIHSNS